MRGSGLQATSYSSRITFHVARFTHHKLRITHYGLLFTPHASLPKEPEERLRLQGGGVGDGEVFHYVRR